jgi:hypothetical protein
MVTLSKIFYIRWFFIVSLLFIKIFLARKKLLQTCKVVYITPVVLSIPRIASNARNHPYPVKGFFPCSPKIKGSFAAPREKFLINPFLCSCHSMMKETIE